MTPVWRWLIRSSGVRALILVIHKEQMQVSDSIVLFQSGIKLSSVQTGFRASAQTYTGPGGGGTHLHQSGGFDTAAMFQKESKVTHSRQTLVHWAMAAGWKPGDPVEVEGPPTQTPAEEKPEAASAAPPARPLVDASEFLLDFDDEEAVSEELSSEYSSDSD